jgi:hypothetical protein
MQDVFKSTTFYPLSRKDHPTGQSPQYQCIETGLPVFARDIDTTCKKTYMACGYEHFCFKHYTKHNDRTRHMYELLQELKPTKIYCDFDHENVADADDFKRSIEQFIKAVLKTLPERCRGLEGVVVPFYILEASTSSKLSRHVIFECYLENIPTVKAFIDFVLTTCPCPYLDTKVYTRNRCFRLLYSYKYGKSQDSALTICGDSTYNPLFVFKTMIQARFTPHYHGALSVMEGELNSTVYHVNLTTRVKGSVNGYSGHCATNVPPGLDEFISEFGEKGLHNHVGGVLLSCKENETFITCIVGGLRCPWAGRVHKSNNTYFTICKSSLKGWFNCSDLECGGSDGSIPYGHMDMSHIWRDQLIK